MGKIFTNSTSYRRLTSKIFKDLKKLDSNKPNKLKNTVQLPTNLRKRAWVFMVTEWSLVTGWLGRLVLVLGDLHIPHQCNSLAAKLKTPGVRKNPEHSLHWEPLHQGELWLSQDSGWLHPYCKRRLQWESEFPKTEGCVTVGQFKISLIYGHQLFHGET